MTMLERKEVLETFSLYAKRQAEIVLRKTI